MWKRYSAARCSTGGLCDTAPRAACQEGPRWSAQRYAMEVLWDCAQLRPLLICKALSALHRGHAGCVAGVENLALAVGHARKKTVQSGSAARCAAPGVRADLRSRHEPCSSQLHRPLHDNHNGSTTAAASAFGQQNTVRGRLQPGKPAAHAATQAGTAAHVLTREGSRWEEFQELSESCGDQELLDTKVAPDHHVARTAWHSTAAHMPDDVSNIVTSYD